MPRDGNGTYSLPAGNPVVTGTTISSTVQNNTTSDIASALTASIAKDGQTVPTANLPMGGFKLTGLGAGTAAGDALRWEQRGIVDVNSQSAAYTTVLTDAGKFILHPTADNNPRTFTIDSNANVAYTVGTCITFVNEINTLTIAITSDTLVLAGAGTTGSRTLAAMGIATALKKTSTSWIISGTGLT